MTDPTRVELTVLGEKITIRTAEDPAYLGSLATFVEERVRAMSAGGRTQTTALVLAAIDIADELFKVRDEESRAAGDVDSRLRTLLSELEKATAADQSRI